MGKSYDAPQSPDPKVTIPLQGQENRRTFDYQLAGMRTNTAGPFGTQTWSRSPQFDEAAYNAAMERWKTQNPSGGAGTVSGGSSPLASPSEWIPGSDSWVPPTGVGTPAGEVPYGGASSGGMYDFGMPSKDQFTNNQWTMTQQLSPEQQALYEANVGSQLGQAGLLSEATSRVGDSLAQPLNWGNLPDLMGAPGVENISGELGGLRGKMGALDPTQINQQMADSVYGINTRYLNPQYADQQKSLESRLADQGFVPGTPAYLQAMDQFSQGRERAYADARDRATAGGITAGNQAFGNSLSSLQSQIASLLQGNQQGFSQRLAQAGFGNNARTQAISEMLARRNQPLNELNALRTGTQVSMPTGATTSATPGLAPVDIMGAYNDQYRNQLGAYNADVAGENALFGDLLGLGALFAPGIGGLGKLFGG